MVYLSAHRGIEPASEDLVKIKLYSACSSSSKAKREVAGCVQKSQGAGMISHLEKFFWQSGDSVSKRQHGGMMGNGRRAFLED